MVGMAFRYLIKRRLRHGLGRAFPAWLFEPGWGLFAPVVVQLPRLPVEDGDLQAALPPGSKSRAVEVVLPSGAFLRREIPLPRAAMSRADAAIALNLRQSLPAQGNGLVWRSDLVSVTGDKATYAVHIAKSAHLASLRQMMSDADRRIEVVRVEGFGPLAGAGSTDRIRKRWVLATAAMITAGLLLAVSIIEWRAAGLRALSAELSVELSALEEQAVAARAAAEQASQSEGQWKANLRLYTAHLGRPDILVSLTEALPDTVWISEMTVSGDQMSLSGFSGEDVSLVLKSLQELDWVQAARLDAPVLVDGLTRQNRFQIGVVIAAGPEA